VFRKFSCFESYQQTSYLIEKAFTHMHCMSWVIYLKFLSAGKFVLIEYLTLNYIFAYFELLFSYFISYLYMCVMKLTLGKIIFLQIFLWFLAFLCEVFGQTWLIVRTQVALSIAYLVVCRSDKCVPHPNAILTGFYLSLCFLCHPHTTTFFWFIMSYSSDLHQSCKPDD
jgi:hypothetical protein